ncbi:MAG: hypothetical protein Q9222_000512 [Ikaeria aurantiellina]
MATESPSRPQLAPIVISASAEEADPRQSLQHVLAAEPSPKRHPTPRTPTPGSGRPKKSSMIWIQEGARDGKEDEATVQSDSYSRAADVNPSHTMTVAHTRRNANGTIGSVYSGNKIRHLKKDDGIPLWRKDIQFAFLHAVFDDKRQVFTKASDGTHGHTFAEVYIDAMARSSKTSKILKEKLLSDRGAALSMAMICLLVNVGRMNTTLNCKNPDDCPLLRGKTDKKTVFPEMRAQLRTYHSIPSLQAHQDPNAYKQLQDAPRLKSILKGASEDVNQPTTIEKVKRLPIPRTNPVNLIFVLSQYAPKVSETHFFPPRDFFDLVMRGTLSSKSRANAFLWLIWFYLESDYSAESASDNPFGPGQVGTPGEPPFKVPPFDHLTEEQANAENVDTQSEKDYGEMKRLERKRILEDDETVGPPMKKARKAALDEQVLPPLSEPDHSPSPSHRGFPVLKSSGVEYPGPDMIMTSVMHDISPTLYDDRGRRSSDRHESTNLRLVLKSRGDNTPNASSPAMPPGAGHPTFSTNANGYTYRRSRPQTSHQKAVDINRKMRVEHILHQQLIDLHTDIRRRKQRRGLCLGYTAMKRIRDLPANYDTDDERSQGPGGLMPNPGEKEDYGEVALRHKKALDRAVRRLWRDDHVATPRGAISGNLKRKRKNAKASPAGEALDQGFQGSHRPYDAPPARLASAQTRPVVSPENGNASRPPIGTKQEEGLDDLDLDLLGENREGEDGVEDLDSGSGINDTDGDGADLSE